MIATPGQGEEVSAPGRSRRRSFREQQDHNRRRFRILLVTFFVSIGAAGWFAGTGFERLIDPTRGDPLSAEAPRPFYQDYRYLMTATALLLGFGHVRRLRRCGDVVVLGLAKATPLKERQFENVVEEMAISAAIRPPRLWVVEDASLNAFAVGWDERHASIAVTRGLLERLERDELQAVVAHEIAHIRNGDTSLMTLLLGMTRAVHLLAPFALGPLGALWLVGAEGGLDDSSEETPPPTPRPSSEPFSLRQFLVLLAWTPVIALSVLVVSLVVSLTLVAIFAVLLISMPLLALAFAVSEIVRDPSDRRAELLPGADPRWMLLLTPCGLMLGPAILVVGLVAPLSLLLLRLAISRNREYDADAGAVELTRNPLGLLSALRKLLHGERRMFLPGSLTAMCIAPAAKKDAGSIWSDWFSTHPPLEERIRRVERMM